MLVVLLLIVDCVLIYQTRMLFEKVEAILLAAFPTVVRIGSPGIIFVPHFFLSGAIAYNEVAMIHRQRKQK